MHTRIFVRATRALDSLTWHQILTTPLFPIVQCRSQCHGVLFTNSHRKQSAQGNVQLFTNEASARRSANDQLSQKRSQASYWDWKDTSHDQRCKKRLP